MKKNGFTLKEILAAIIIMGIVGAIGVAAVGSYILDARKSASANLAMKLAESARDMRGQDKLPKDLASGEAIVFPCDKLSGNEVDLKNGTGFGDILYDYCYVGIAREGNNYKYYVTLIDTANYGYIAIDYDEITKDRLSHGDDIVLDTSISLGGMLSSFKNTYKGVVYRITAARLKHETSSGISIYGYYSNDTSTNVASQYNNTLEECDKILTTSPQIIVNGTSYTVNNSEVEYILLKKPDKETEPGV